MHFTRNFRRASARWRGLGLLVAAVLLVVAGPPSAAVAAGPVVSSTPDRTVGFDGLVYSSAYVGTTLYLGGSFRNAIVNGRLVPRKGLAAVDARTGALLPWTPPAVNRAVWGMAVSGSWLYLTGRFTKVGGQSRPGLANVHLGTGALGPLSHTINGEGHVLTAAGGRLYLGGDFGGVDGRPARNLAAFRLADGSRDTAFTAGTDGKVKALTVAGTRLYVGGFFKRLNGVEGTARLGALRLADGQRDSTFRPATPYGVFGVTVGPSGVYAGLAGPGGRVAAYRPDGGLIWSTVTDGDVQAITYLAGVVYAGGHFTVACSRPSRSATSWCPTALRSQPKLEALDPATGWLLDWNPRSNGVWGVLTVSANRTLGAIAVGGEFTAFAGVSRPHFGHFRLPTSPYCTFTCGR